MAYFPRGIKSKKSMPAASKFDESKSEHARLQRTKYLRLMKANKNQSNVNASFILKSTQALKFNESGYKLQKSMI